MSRSKYDYYMDKETDLTTKLFQFHNEVWTKTLQKIMLDEMRKDMKKELKEEIMNEIAIDIQTSPEIERIGDILFEQLKKL